MNSSSYDANMLHQDQTHPVHVAQHTNITPAISSFFHPHATSIPMPAHQESGTQLQHPTISTGVTNDSQVVTNPTPVAASHPSGGLFDPRQVQLANALEKTFFNTTTAGIQTSGQRYYSGVPSTAATTVATNPVHHITPPQHHHHHQQGNTILITNNFSAHQYGGTNPHIPDATAQLLPRATTGGIIDGLPSAVTTANSSYNNTNAGNIRIITTLPSTLHQSQQQQQQQHNVFTNAKAPEATVRDDILQQFYHTPHQQAAAYAQHLSTMLPTHFTQQHFTATTSAPASVQLPQDDIHQQHQFFMSMTNDNDNNPAVAATTTLTAVPKLIPTLTAEVTTGTDAVTTSPTMIASPATTTSSNSTLVLDRINICINNHYSDSLAANNGIPTASLDTNGTNTTAVITPAAHTFSMAAHAPQQPSPIIPAIHHKVVLDAVSSGASSVGLHTDSYASNDSTLVIDEPDSTTTTPHTPPTTPENSSPPPPPLNLATTRTIVTAQTNVVQHNVEDIVVDGKENYLTTPTANIPLMKALMDKMPDKTTTTSAAVHTTPTTITQRIDLLDDDESDYANSEVEIDTDVGKATITIDPINDGSIMKIENNEVELPTPETVRMKINTKPLDAASSSLISPHIIVAESHVLSAEILQESNLDSSPSPTTANTVHNTANETASSVTLLTPPTPTTSSPHLQDEPKMAISPAAAMPEISFSMGEDVFIRKDDGRQYLGTVIGSSASSGGMTKRQKVQYLIRFDDNSELWCGADGMRRLGSSGGKGIGTQMCVACKRTQVQDVVEICDDCRRGYHRSCTRETTIGSGVWWCLRCSKPMKVPPTHIAAKTICRSLSQYNRSYKNAADTSKTMGSSQKLKTPADVYEFHIEDNEIYTSDDEIPIKHIMDKARKSRDLNIQNFDVASFRPKSMKNTEGILCATIAALDDENANDANGIGKMSLSPKKEKMNKDKEVLSGVKSKPTHSIANLKPCPGSSDIAGKISECLLAPQTVDNKSDTTVYNKDTAMPRERSSRKRKAFTLSNTYKEVAAEAASKRYDSSRLCDSSSDENSSSSRGTSLDVIIPPPKNFLGLNNPFRMVTPKKNSSVSQIGGMSAGCIQSLLNFNGNGKMIKSSIFNTTALDFSSKLAALKSAGIFPNLSTSNLAKAAGQPRTVRTIKRRLSAKDIMIGPNQEVRRRRTRRLSSNIEIISTTTINPIPSNFFPIHAKDLFSAHTHLSTATTNSTRNMSLNNKRQHQPQPPPPTAVTCVSASSISSSSSASSSPPGSVTSSVDSQIEVIAPIKPLHGRRLRQRPQKNSPGNSRRSSISSASTASSTNSSSNITLATLQQQQQALHSNSNKSANNMSTTNGSSMQDLKQSVKEYFGGVMNRIESGEQFCIRAKRQLTNGQMQYLIEWGDVATLSLQAQTTQATVISNTSQTSTTTETVTTTTTTTAMPEVDH